MSRLTRAILLIGLAAGMGCQGAGAGERIRDEVVDQRLTRPQPPAAPPSTPSPEPRPEFQQEPQGQ